MSGTSEIISITYSASAWIVGKIISLIPFLFQLFTMTVTWLSILTLLGVFLSPRGTYKTRFIILAPPCLPAYAIHRGLQRSAIGTKILDISSNNIPLVLLFSLLAIKFNKIIVQAVAFHFSSYQRAAPIPRAPTVFPEDVTVIIPTIGDVDTDVELTCCIRSILANNPARIIISTVGPERKRAGDRAAQMILLSVRLETGISHPFDKILVVEMNEGNKRAQIMKAVEIVHTKFMAYVDDHVFWPTTYLTSVLSEFEDQRVGIVGTAKSVTRQRKPWTWNWSVISDNLRNFFACIYLERHNFECTATYNLDGGVFVISGRTAVVRSEIFKSQDFQRGYLNETWLSGLNICGIEIGIRRAMKVDDDNFVTRFMVNNGWRTVFRNTPDAIMDNTLGTVGGWKKFNGQLLRWSRTTYRSNLTSLLRERVCWYRYPWTTYAMFMHSFINVALIMDPLLFFLLMKSGAANLWTVMGLSLLLLATKAIKPARYYRRNPQDLVLFPVQVLFAYYHGLIRILAFLTMRNIAWTGRPNVRA